MEKGGEGRLTQPGLPSAGASARQRSRAEEGRVMASRNRVVWSEGLFIKPQHFQQQQRSLEGLLETRLRGVSHKIGRASSRVRDHMKVSDVCVDQVSGNDILCMM